MKYDRVKMTKKVEFDVPDTYTKSAFLASLTPSENLRLIEIGEEFTKSIKLNLNNPIIEEYKSKIRNLEESIDRCNTENKKNINSILYEQTDIVRKDFEAKLREIVNTKDAEYKLLYNKSNNEINSIRKEMELKLREEVNLKDVEYRSLNAKMHERDAEIRKEYDAKLKEREKDMELEIKELHRKRSEDQLMDKKSYNIKFEEERKLESNRTDAKISEYKAYYSNITSERKEYDAKIAEEIAIERKNNEAKLYEYRDTINKVTEERASEKRTYDLKLEEERSKERKIADEQISRINKEIKEQIEELRIKFDAEKTLEKNKAEERVAEYREQITKQIEELRIKFDAEKTLEKNKAEEFDKKYHSLESKFIGVNDEYLKYKHDENSRNKAMMNKLAEQMIDKTEECAQLEKKIYTIMQTNSNQIREIEKEFNAAREKVETYYHNIIAEKESALYAEIKKMNDMYNYNKLSNLEKGNLGESKVEFMLQELYPASIITDKSAEPHSCDMLFQSSELKLECLIEVKFKKVIKSEDVTRFVSDVHARKAKINSAMFISLNSKNIPNIGNFKITYIDNIPIIYIYVESQDTIKFCIDILCHLVKTLADKIDNKILDTAIGLITDTYSTIRKEIKRLDIAITSAEKTLIILKENRKSLIESTFKIKQFRDTFRQDDAVLDSKNDNPYANDLPAIKQWIIDNKRIPKRDDIKRICNLTAYAYNNRNALLPIKEFIKTTFDELNQEE